MKQATTFLILPIVGSLADDYNAIMESLTKNAHADLARTYRRNAQFVDVDPSSPYVEIKLEGGIV